MAGIWLQNRRQHLGMSQEDLASRLQLAGFDVARSSISHWEQSKHSPPYDNPKFLNALSEILDLSIPKILYMAGYNLSGQHGEIAEQAAYLIDSLPPDKQKLALRMVELLKE